MQNRPNISIIKYLINPQLSLIPSNSSFFERPYPSKGRFISCAYRPHISTSYPYIIFYPHRSILPPILRNTAITRIAKRGILTHTGFSNPPLQTPSPSSTHHNNTYMQPSVCIRRALDNQFLQLGSHRHDRPVQDGFGEDRGASTGEQSRKQGVQGRAKGLRGGDRGLNHSESMYGGLRRGRGRGGGNGSGSRWDGGVGCYRRRRRKVDFQRDVSEWGPLGAE